MGYEPVRAAVSQKLGLLCVRDLYEDSWVLWRFVDIDLVYVTSFKLPMVPLKDDVQLKFLGEESSTVVVLHPSSGCLLFVASFTGACVDRINVPDFDDPEKRRWLFYGLAVSSPGDKIAVATMNSDVVILQKSSVSGAWVVTRRIRPQITERHLRCQLAFARAGRLLGILCSIDTDDGDWRNMATWQCVDLCAPPDDASAMVTCERDSMTLFVSQDCCFYGFTIIGCCWRFTMPPGYSACGHSERYFASSPRGCQVEGIRAPGWHCVRQVPRNYENVMLPNGMGCAVMEPVLNRDYHYKFFADHRGKAIRLRQVFVPVWSRDRIAWMGTVYRARFVRSGPGVRRSNRIRARVQTRLPWR